MTKVFVSRWLQAQRCIVQTGGGGILAQRRSSEISKLPDNIQDFCSFKVWSCFAKLFFIGFSLSIVDPLLRHAPVFTFQNMGMVETHTDQSGPDGSGLLWVLNIGWVEIREGGEIRLRPVVSNNFISKHFSARGAHPSALYVIFHSNQYSVRAQLPVLVFERSVKAILY